MVLGSWISWKSENQTTMSLYCARWESMEGEWMWALWTVIGSFYSLPPPSSLLGEILSSFPLPSLICPWIGILIPTWNLKVLNFVIEQETLSIVTQCDIMTLECEDLASYKFFSTLPIWSWAASLIFFFLSYYLVGDKDTWPLSFMGLLRKIQEIVDMKIFCEGQWKYWL